MSMEAELDHEQELPASMIAIAEHLDTLSAAAARMTTVYATAAESSDLTFIKIIEDKYRSLWNVLQQLADQAAEVSGRTAEESLTGRLDNGRQEPSAGYGVVKRVI